MAFCSLVKACNRTRLGQLCLKCLAFLLALSVTPVVLPVTLILRLYRLTLMAIIRRLRGDKVLMVKGADALWLQDSVENRAIINILTRMKGRADAATYKKAIQERILDAVDSENRKQRMYPKVTKYPSTYLHRFVWLEEEEFDISEHVFYHPSPISDSKKALDEAVSGILSEPLPPGKAVWQVIILQVDDSQGSKPDFHHVVFRFHHAMADGIGILRLVLQKLVDETPDEVKQKRFGTTHSLWKILQAVFTGPYLLIQRALLAADNNILHGQELSGRKLISCSESLDLNLIKRMKNATGTTINDILVACVAGAFREYFKRFSLHVPSDLLAYVPVDVRAPHSRLEMDNQFTLVFLKLPLDIEDSLDLLKETKTRMDQIKESAEPLVNAMFLRFCMSRLPKWLNRWFFDWLSRKCSIVLSNIPGPSSSLSVVGRKMQEAIFWPPQRSTIGLGVSILTYDGRVRLGVLSDKAVLDNPHLLTSEFVNQVTKMAASLQIL